jgi:hypothetical protein
LLPVNKALADGNAERSKLYRFIQIVQYGIKPLHLPGRIGKDIIGDPLGLVVFKVVDKQRKILIE